MIAAVLVGAVCFQAAVWTVSPRVATVGDTVRFTRRIVAAPDVVARALLLPSSPDLLPLAEPVVGYSEGAVFVRYTVAFFAAGEHAVVMPDVELTRLDGGIERVPGDTVHIRVASVLPEGDSLPPPRPLLEPVERPVRRSGPLLLLVLAVAAGATAWAVARRRTRPRPKWDVDPGPAPEAPVQQWLRAGEQRAAVGAVADRLREVVEEALPAAARRLSTQECLDVIAAERPDWPLRDIEDALRSLDRAQFAPAVPTDVALLIDQVDDLVKALREAPGEEPS